MNIKRSEVREVTPEMYGAVGDGITDDTLAINAAADAARAYGIPFHFSKDYYITDSLNFTGTAGGWYGEGVFKGNHGWNIYGDGEYITNIYADLQEGYPVFDFTGTEKVHFHDIHVTGKRSGQQTAGVLFAMAGDTNRGVFPEIARVQIDGQFSKCGLVNISADLSIINNCLIFGPVGVFYGHNDFLEIRSKYRSFTTLPGQNTIHNIYGGGIQGSENCAVLIDHSTGSVNAFGANTSIRGTATAAIKVTGDHAKVFWYACRMESISSAENTHILYAEKAPQYSHFSGSYNINGVGPFFYIPTGQFLQNSFIHIDPGLPNPGQSPQTALMFGGGGCIRNCIIYNGKGINADLPRTGNNNNTVYGQGCAPWENFIAGHVMNVWYGANRLYVGCDLEVIRKLYVGGRQI